jgi:hypothetical protein
LTWCYRGLHSAPAQSADFTDLQTSPSAFRPTSCQCGNALDGKDKRRTCMA